MKEERAEGFQTLAHAPAERFSRVHRALASWEMASPVYIISTIMSNDTNVPEGEDFLHS